MVAPRGPPGDRSATTLRSSAKQITSCCPVKAQQRAGTMGRKPAPSVLQNGGGRPVVDADKDSSKPGFS